MKIKVLVIPNAKESEVVKIDDVYYRIKVDATASEGSANKRLIEILSEHFKVKKSSVKILKGFRNRNKIVSIDNLYQGPVV
jgi:uncharacterized protein (TIGR00251 family)